MMTRTRIHLLVTLLVVGLMCITSLSVSAQDEPEPEDDRITVTAFRRSVTYVAPTADGTTDIHVLEILDEAGIIDHDNDPTTPRVFEDGSYKISNVTNTPGVNEIDPLFSPLGDQILYRGEADPTTYPGVNSLFVVDSDGENPIQITPNGVNVFYSIFSPDGMMVAYMAQWGSQAFKLFASDSNGENPVALTPGEGFNAAFPLWRLNENGAEEIDYLRFGGDGSQVVGIDPQTAAERWSTDPVNEQWWILQPFTGELATFIRRENSDADWEIATINLDTRDVAQITDNTTNDCCAQAVWSVDGTVTTDMSPSGLASYFLSDTEDGGRDIYSVGLDGSNPVNLTVTDDREYTSLIDLSYRINAIEFEGGANAGVDALLVGYNEFEGERAVPRLGLTWDIGDRQITGNYEFLELTEGSDPDVVDPISLTQLEQLAADGLLPSCTYTFFVGEERDYANEVYSEPSESAAVVRSLVAGDTVQVTGVQPSPSGNWLHLTDGTWVKEVDLDRSPDCPPLPTISRYTL